MTDFLESLKKRLDNTEPVSSVIVKNAKLIQVSGLELRQLCEKYPKHPVVVTGFSKAVKDLPDERMVNVEEPDLRAVLEGKAVQITTAMEKEVESGEMEQVRRKILVPLSSQTSSEDE